MKLQITSFKKDNVGTLEVPDDIFNVEVQPHLLQTIVRWQLACRRAGTVATKTKGMVRGGGKKPFKQKGTGNARQGSSRSPLMPGGGTAFGPQPRDYSYTLPKGVRRAGLCAALTSLVKNGKFYVFDTVESDGKTKQLSAQLHSFGLERAILVDSQDNETLKRAARNLRSFKFLPPVGVNVFDLLKHEACIVSKASLAQLIERLG